MTHTEEIKVYQFTGTHDGYAGSNETAVLQGAAPKWATIELMRSVPEQFAMRSNEEQYYNVYVNWKPGWNWRFDQFIRCRFGDLHIIGVAETVRKRVVKLQTAQIVK